jgi:membrane-associated phospholipid phosphatase
LVLSGDMVLRWNEALFATVQAVSPPNPAAGRAAAIVQAAVYDAVNSIDGTHTPYLADIPAPSGASEEAAAATAAHDTLVALFPTQATALDLQLLASLQTIPDGDAKTAGIMVGQVAAQNVLSARADDGSNKPMSYTPGTNPGDWQPTPPAYLPASLPGWGMVTPFCLQSGSQFRPPPPPALTDPEYTAAFNQIKDLGSAGSTTRTADQTEAAIFWQGVYASPNCYLIMLNQIGRQVAVARGNSLVDNARLFALLDLTLADCYIACWEAKYTYNFWRPVTAIRAADTDGNPDTVADPNWTPLMATPAFPSYPSGHSTVVAGSTAILASFFGTDAIPFSVSYAGLPGVTRSFDSFSAAANECGLSRIWVGFHWSFDVSAGLAQGQSIGSYVTQNFLLPRTSPPPGGSAAPILVAPRGFRAAEQTEPLMLSGLLQGGFPLPANGATAGLPVEQPLMNPVPADTACSSVVVDSGFGEDAVPFSVSSADLPGVTRSHDGFTAAANEQWMTDRADLK